MDTKNNAAASNQKSARYRMRFTLVLFINYLIDQLVGYVWYVVSNINFHYTLKVVEEHK